MIAELESNIDILIWNYDNWILSCQDWSVLNPFTFIRSDLWLSLLYAI